jgi:hypothetical protein
MICAELRIDALSSILRADPYDAYDAMMEEKGLGWYNKLVAGEVVATHWSLTTASGKRSAR